MMVILVVYMFGAMCIKYTAGSKSFVNAISYLVYDDGEEWTKKASVDPYYLGIFIFAGFSLIFSFGNIENSKVLQIVTGIIRYITIIFLYGSTLYYLFTTGINAADPFDV